MKHNYPKWLFMVAKNIASGISVFAASIFIANLVQNIAKTQYQSAFAIGLTFAILIEMIVIFALIFAVQIQCETNAKNFRNANSNAKPMRKIFAMQIPVQKILSVPLWIVAISFYAIIWYCTSKGFITIVEKNNEVIDQIETKFESKTAKLESKYQIKIDQLSDKYDSISSLKMPSGAIARNIRLNTLKYYENQISKLQNLTEKELSKNDEKLNTEIKKTEIQKAGLSKDYKGIATIVMICVFLFNILFVYYDNQKDNIVIKPVIELVQIEEKQSETATNIQIVNTIINQAIEVKPEQKVEPEKIDELIEISKKRVKSSDDKILLCKDVKIRLQNGESKEQIATYYNCNVGTIYRWLQNS